MSIIYSNEKLYKMTQTEMIEKAFDHIVLSYKEAIQRHPKGAQPVGYILTPKPNAEKDTDCSLHEVPNVASYFNNDATIPLIAYACKHLMEGLKAKGLCPIAAIFIYDSYVVSAKRGEELDIEIRLHPARKDCILGVLYTPEISVLQSHVYEVIGNVMIFKEEPTIGNVKEGLFENPFHLSK